MKINSKCDKIYGDVLLDSYIWLILSAFLFQIVNFIATEYAIPYSKQKFAEIKTKIMQCLRKDKLPKKEIKTMTTIYDEYSAGLTFLWYQILVSYISFIGACISQPSTSSKIWIQYTNVYGAYINNSALTPIITVLFSLMRFGIATLSERKVKWELDFPEEAEKILKSMGFLSYLPLVPAIYTHIIPGIILFPWMPVLMVILFVIYFGMCVLLSKLTTRLIKIKYSKKFISTVLQFGFRICCLLLFQSLFNYTALYYGEDYNYLSAISRDYQYRSQTLCILKEEFVSVQSIFNIFDFM